MFSKGHEIDKLRKGKYFQFRITIKCNVGKPIAMDINNTLLYLLTLCNAPS